MVPTAYINPLTKLAVDTDTLNAANSQVQYRNPSIDEFRAALEEAKKRNVELGPLTVDGELIPPLRGKSFVPSLFAAIPDESLLKNNPYVKKHPDLAYSPGIVEAQKRGPIARLMGRRREAEVEQPIDEQFVAKFLDERNVDSDPSGAEYHEPLEDVETGLKYYQVPPPAEEYFFELHKLTGKNRVKMNPYHIERGKSLANRIFIEGILKGKINGPGDVLNGIDLIKDILSYNLKGFSKEVGIPPKDARKILTVAAYHLGRRAHLAARNYETASKFRNFIRRITGREPIGGDPRRHSDLISAYLDWGLG